jgi:hypothetical protein
MAFTQVLTCVNISHLNSSPLPPSFIPSPITDFWSNFNRYHFSSTNMCKHFLYRILHPTPLIGSSSPPHRQDLFCPPVLWFCRRKR